MIFNSFLEDINDEEDYSQYKELLILLGFSSEGADNIIRTRKHQFSEKARKTEIAAVNRAMTGYTQTEIVPRGDLDTIINPSNELLEELPTYHRYILYLLSEMTNTDAGKIVRMPRNTMWRWLKKQGYPLRYTYDKHDNLSL